MENKNKKESMRKPKREIAETKMRFVIRRKKGKAAAKKRHADTIVKNNNMNLSEKEWYKKGPKHSVTKSSKPHEGDSMKSSDDAAVTFIYFVY